MKLEEIGFYTLSNARAENVSISSPLWRCELLLTDKCNFKCPYCRGMRDDLKGTMSLERAREVIDLWADQGLRNIRFSGGEPTVYKFLPQLVSHAHTRRIKRIAVSTNGSADIEYYKHLIELGVNDFSISLDACCSSVGEKMCGGVKGAWEKVTKNIATLSTLTYLTVGVVFTEETLKQSLEIIEYADSLGVSDIRIISSAQFNGAMEGVESLGDDILDRHPILKYRVTNYRNGRNVRGIKEGDSHKCSLVLDDMAIAGDYHFPCIIYLRENGNPIGRIGSNMREERLDWFNNHDTHTDIICKNNCLDVCIDHNNVADMNGKGGKNEVG